MNDKKTPQEKITAYTLDALCAELEELTRFPVDPHSKFVYERVVELYWTVSRTLRQLRDLLQRNPGPPSDALLAGDVPAPPARERLFIDMTNTIESGSKTGIQRVVRRIALESVRAGLGLPVVIEGGRLVPYYRHPSLPLEVQPAEGDVFLVLDAAWNNVGVYLSALDAVKAAGGKIVVAAYDILPLEYPALFHQNVTRSFRSWRENVLAKADAIVAISRATAEALADHERRAGRQRLPAIGWWPLGADFGAGCAEGASPAAAKIIAGGPYLLSVGTLEPRKGYPIALDAFEKLWAAGREISYVIVGKGGWNTSALRARIRRHPQFGRRLHWLDKAGDADLQALYAHARASVNASLAEGFGLPLVESALHGLPVIASDIGVFREVAGDGARYFDLLDSASLAQAIDAELSASKTPPKIGAISWAQSAQALARLIREESYQMSGSLTLGSHAGRSASGLR